MCCELLPAGHVRYIQDDAALRFNISLLFLFTQVGSRCGILSPRDIWLLTCAAVPD
jgi:hypothetical protein